jgi:hypothetical protein
MKRLRALSFATALAVSTGSAAAFGVNDIFDVFVDALETDRAAFLDPAAVARIDNALVALRESSDESVTLDVKALRTAVKKLGPLGADPAIAPDLTQAMNALYGQVLGRAVQSAAATAQWLGQRPGIGPAATVFRTNLAITRRVTKIENAQNNASWTPKRKLNVFHDASRFFDGVIRRFGS